MLWSCESVNQIWTNLGNWISTKINCHLKIEKELIFLHDIEAGNYTNIINLLILIVSRYIYACKCLELKPRFDIALKKIKEFETIERQIARGKGKEVIHYKKWGLIAE